MPPDAPDGPPEPAILLAERVFEPTGRVYFLSVLPEVPTAAVDRRNALELRSADIEVFGGAVYVRNRDNNTMTRYRVTSDRRLEEDGQFSFVNKGLAGLRYYSAFVSPTQAFVLDSTEWRLIEWNPTTMRLAGTPDIPIDFMEKANLDGEIEIPVKVGDRLIGAAYWTRGLSTYPGSGVAIVSAAAPTTPAFAEDRRIGGAFRVYPAANGDAYVVGVVAGSIRNYGTTSDGSPMPDSGILRIRAGETTFDPDYIVNIEQLTGSPGVRALHRLDDRTLLVQVFDPSKPLPANANDYDASGDYVFMFVDTETRTTTRVDAIPQGGTANAGNHVVDGRLFIQYGTQDGSVVKSVGGDQQIRDAFTVPAGDLWHFERIR